MENTISVTSAEIPSWYMKGLQKAIGVQNVGVQTKMNREGINGNKT